MGGALTSRITTAQTTSSCPPPFQGRNPKRRPCSSPCKGKVGMGALRSGDRPRVPGRQAERGAPGSREPVIARPLDPGSTCGRPGGVENQRRWMRRRSPADPGLEPGESRGPKRASGGRAGPGYASGVPGASEGAGAFIPGFPAARCARAPGPTCGLRNTRPHPEQPRAASRRTHHRWSVSRAPAKTGARGHSHRHRGARP